MGLPVEVNNLMLGSLGGYTVGRSLRFRSSATAYLNRTAGTPTNANIWTWSAWVKKSSLGVLSTLMCGGSTNVNYITFNDTGTTDYFGLTYANTPSQLVNVMTTQTFRDPSAWYHLMVVYDSTSATSTITGSATDRVRLYVNGVQVTAFSATSGPAQNTAVNINSASAVLNIGRRNAATPNGYFDGYLAEVNFIDGQALTPSSFGAYDTNGVWQPKKYTGTYGTNGFYLPFSGPTTNGFSSYYASFNGSNQYLSIADNAAFDLAASDFTLEAWVNPSSSGGATARNVMNQSNSGAGSNSSFYFGAGNDGIALYLSTSGTSWTNYAQTSVPIGVGQWSHVVWQRRGNTLEIYLNGVLQTVTSGSSSFSGTVFNSSRNVEIGTQNAAACWFHGSISNLRFVKGSAVYTANFTPPTSATTTITNTQLLTLQNATFVDNSANAFSITNNNGVTSTSGTVGNYWTIANDQSGNNNHWVTNNISLTSGTTYDSMIDSPTNAAGTSTGIGNYATLNPLGINGSVGTFSNANLTWLSAQNAGGFAAASTIPANTGGTSKWYCEVTMGTRTSTYHTLGLSTTTNPWTSPYYIVYRSDGLLTNNGTTVGTYATFGAGDVIGMAFDNATGVISFYKNNTYIGQTTASLSYLWYFIVAGDSTAGGATYHCNFGQQPFVYTPPSGFKALNTYNLPAPSIANGAQYMAATTYTANGTTQSISNAVNGVLFQPDLVWQKRRNSAGSHYLADSLRGASKLLSSDTTAAEATNTTFLTSFNSDGWSQGTGNYTNGESIVGWQWKGGGTGVTNTSGTITSTVSANPSAGFSIVTYTGTGAAAATVGHGLGVAPVMMIMKARSFSPSAWSVYHTSTGIGNELLLNSTAAAAAASNDWNNTLPTSSVFTLGTAGSTNTSGATYVAYCFSAVSGYSAFGKYTGNGSADGPFIYTGFRPKFVLVKSTSAVGDWEMRDTSRDAANVSYSSRLFANLSSAEDTSGFPVDFLSNGFKCRGTGTNSNGSGTTYIYMAFAENPFNYSRAR